MLKFLLPFHEKSKIINALEFLDRQQNITIDLQLNSLEEAFVNIGMDEERFIEKAERAESFNVQEV